MALTTNQQELLDFALSGLPGWFQAEGRAMEFLGGCAVLFDAARNQLDYWFSQALIGSAVGATSTTPDWLGQHAADRDTRRQAAEGDPALRARLKNVPDALNRQSLVDAAQAIVDASGVVGDVAIVEPLRYWRAFFVTNVADAGVGGTFTVTGSVITFEPTVPFARPPFKSFEPTRGHQLTLSGSSSAGNDGAFEITDLDEDAAVYANGGAVAGADPTVVWRVDLLDGDGNVLTDDGAGGGRSDSYLSRGYRMATRRAALILILPYGTTAGTAAGIVEMLRQKKAAGIGVIIERRLSP
jgi:hypothetical protein